MMQLLALLAGLLIAATADAQGILAIYDKAGRHVFQPMGTPPPRTSTKHCSFTPGVSAYDTSVYTRLLPDGKADYVIDFIIWGMLSGTFYNLTLHQATPEGKVLYRYPKELRIYHKKYGDYYSVLLHSGPIDYNGKCAWTWDKRDLQPFPGWDNDSDTPSGGAPTYRRLGN
jgi:hypothetical protein